MRQKITVLFVGKSDILLVSAPNRFQSTSPGKRQRVGSILGQESTGEDMALLINCIQPTGVFINARVEGYEQKCLIDTAATVSLVSHQLVPSPLMLCSLKAQGIGSEALQVLGQTELQIQLGKSTFVHSFVVVGMANICILGADFLKAGKMTVDVGNCNPSWTGGDMPLVVEHTIPSVNKLSVLLENYSDVFVNSPNDLLGCARDSEHIIDNGDSCPATQSNSAPTESQFIFKL